MKMFTSVVYYYAFQTFLKGKKDNFPTVRVQHREDGQELAARIKNSTCIIWFRKIFRSVENIFKIICFPHSCLPMQKQTLLSSF
jgi:hypothetical protein